ncbi:hypothetical protein KY290_007637 [Solanum tuberosum]|uniref:Retrotransposon gag domain-containing protein n=1 Tax=Solanum tuberosum TaxID=4113 RepID=A0ABQ7W649_SOLTU|nr:hypothetical protein KY290_007637 [Solanum tuberosum]
MEDQRLKALINESIKEAKESFSKDIADIRHMLQEVTGKFVPTGPHIRDPTMEVARPHHGKDTLEAPTLRHRPASVELGRFRGENPEAWIFQAERYFDFYGIAEMHKLTLASFYLNGEALEWYQWLFYNKQLAGWDHFVDKLLICFRSRTRDKQREFLPIPRNKNHRAVEYSQAVSPSLVNIETLGPMLDSKYDLKNNPNGYACKVFAEMPDKKIDMEVEHTVITDSTNLASHMFDENFQTVSAFKGEYGELIMFDNNCLALPCLPSIFSRTQLMGRSIFDYFKEFGHANLPLSLYRFPPDHFGFSFPFDPGSSLLPVILGAANNYSRMVVDDFKELIAINDTKNMDTPLVSQNKEANSRNYVAWVIDMSLHRDTTSFLISLANKEYIVTKGYIAPKGHTKLLMSVISHIYNVEIMFFESLNLLKAEGWSRPVIIWSNVLLIGKVVRELPTPASNLLMLVCIASSIALMRILTMISNWYYLNLEDKVLIGAEGIVMNGPRPVLTKQPKAELKGYVWDPG